VSICPNKILLNAILLCVILLSIVPIKVINLSFAQVNATPMNAICPPAEYHPAIIMQNVMEVSNEELNIKIILFYLKRQV
jgi:hypothetical protein